MPLQAEAVVQARVDPLRGISPIVPPMPGRTVVRHGGENMPVGRLQKVSHYPAVVAGCATGGAITGRPALAAEIVGRRRAAVLQRFAIRFEAAERHRAFLPRHRRKS